MRTFIVSSIGLIVVASGCALFWPRPVETAPGWQHTQPEFGAPDTDLGSPLDFPEESSDGVPGVDQESLRRPTPEPEPELEPIPEDDGPEWEPTAGRGTLHRTKSQRSRGGVRLGRPVTTNSGPIPEKGFVELPPPSQ